MFLDSREPTLHGGILSKIETAFVGYMCIGI